MDLLDRADLMIVIRTGLSESTAFEVAYNIFGGKGVPVFFAIWDQAPIRTTLLRDLDELVPVQYATFSKPEELKESLLSFISNVVVNQQTIEDAGSTIWMDISDCEDDEVSMIDD